MMQSIRSRVGDFIHQFSRAGTALTSRASVKRPRVAHVQPRHGPFVLLLRTPQRPRKPRVPPQSCRPFAGATRAPPRSPVPSITPISTRGWSHRAAVITRDRRHVHQSKERRGFAGARSVDTNRKTPCPTAPARLVSHHRLGYVRASWRTLPNNRKPPRKPPCISLGSG